MGTRELKIWVSGKPMTRLDANGEPERFYVSQNKFGHWLVVEGDINPRLWGPFMDYRDAIEQSGASEGAVIYQGPR